MTKKTDFLIGEKVVYPAHGVGKVVQIESQNIAGTSFDVYVIAFSQEKMTLRIPVNRATQSGLRHLIKQNEVDDIYKILNSKPKRGNKMWSRRAQEYENKIYSGDLIAISEVVRDLYKNAEGDRSYSERTIYESAMSRLASEIAVLEESSEKIITEKLTNLLKEKLTAA